MKRSNYFKIVSAVGGKLHIIRTKANHILKDIQELEEILTETFTKKQLTSLINSTNIVGTETKDILNKLSKLSILDLATYNNLKTRK